MKKYHIDKNGLPAVCKAKRRPCPLGGDDVHFDSYEEANLYAQEKLKSEYGLLGDSDNKEPPKQELTGFELKRAREEKIAELIEDLESRNNYSRRNYIARCFSSEKIPRLWTARKTNHVVLDRQAKEDRLIEMYGEGNYIGDYKVFHQVGSMHAPKYQYTRIYDNGRIIMYDYDTKEKITTFMAHETRIAGVLLRAGEIPDEEMLERIKQNYQTEKSTQRQLGRSNPRHRGQRRRRR